MLGQTVISRPSVVLCDARLRVLRIAYWTTVPISNNFAASVISLYLTNQHPVLGTFDAGLFLDDLVAQKLRYCSPLLVNSILHFGCVCMSAPPRCDANDHCSKHTRFSTRLHPGLRGNSMLRRRDCGKRTRTLTR